MEILGLIPARGGSKGIPRKNLARVAGRPLISWTVDAARGATELTRVVVSTDDEEIAESAGVEVLRRPTDLAGDGVPMLQVVRHALDTLEPDAVVVLQPTSPLRRPQHVDDVVRLLRETGADCVVSVVAVPHRYRPDALMDVVDGRLFARGAARTRNDKTVVYARNGPAVLALRADRLADDFYAGDCRAYVMDERDSLDVDTRFELELADLLLRSR
jgi:CMP-N-acetylneuraminic acid synthetase